MKLAKFRVYGFRGPSKCSLEGYFRFRRGLGLGVHGLMVEVLGFRVVALRGFEIGDFRSAVLRALTPDKRILRGIAVLILPFFWLGGTTICKKLKSSCLDPLRNWRSYESGVVLSVPVYSSVLLLR